MLSTVDFKHSIILCVHFYAAIYIATRNQLNFTSFIVLTDVTLFDFNASIYTVTCNKFFTFLLFCCFSYLYSF